MNATRTVTAIVLVSTLALLSAPAESVSGDAASKWIQYLTPLPREIKISGKLSLKVGDVAIIANTNGGQIVEQAIGELSEVLGNAAPEKAKFKLTLLVDGPEKESLKALKN